MQGVLVFIIEKMMVEMFKLLELGINKLPSKSTKEKEKEKETASYREITPPEALIDQEGWKVSFPHRMYTCS
jgi:uncharacterized membrane protein YagU involved in acid resistance